MRRAQRGRKRNVEFAVLRNEELIPITGIKPCRIRNLKEPYFLCTINRGMFTPSNATPYCTGAEPI